MKRIPLIPSSPGRPTPLRTTVARNPAQTEAAASAGGTIKRPEAALRIKRIRRRRTAAPIDRTRRPTRTERLLQPVLIEASAAEVVEIKKYFVTLPVNMVIL